MLAAQRAYGPHDQHQDSLGPTAFGRALFRTLPEDRLDRQPLIDSSRRWLMVADVRLDNRAELLALLGQPEGAQFSDSEILFQLWVQRHEAALDHMLGDFAFAVWDARDETLALIRDPAGQRPLHYCRAGNFAAFSSMPCGLLAHPDIASTVDDSQLAAFIADIPREAGATFFKAINRVNPGEVLTIRRQGLSARRYWRLPQREIRFAREDEYVEAFREQLDRATRARLRGAEERVGVHLSAGLDSGAVAATAARIQSETGGQAVAFTSAPRAGFSGSVPPPRIADESNFAGQVAAQYPNMEHVIVRSGDVSPLDLIGADAELFQEPIGHPCNIVWWWAVHDAARARGLSVMLTGEAGNLTISAGNLAMLADYVRGGRLLRWWREARAVAGAGSDSGPTWRGTLAASFGPWLPRSGWRWLNRMAGRGGSEQNGLALLHPAWRERLAHRAAAQARSTQPEKDNRKFRWELMHQHEPGNFRKGILARWGIDERDPTADRRLAEFCFSVPPEILFGGGMMRRLAKIGLADRLPAVILNAPRGYQYADWYERIDRAGLDQAVAGIRAGRAATLLDTDALRALTSSWPTADWNSLHNIGKYRLAFLMALSAGAFANRMSR